MEHFTPFQSLAGGMLIGLSATGLLLLLGRIAGISGIVAALLTGDELPWRGAFVAGLFAGGLLTSVFYPSALAMTLDRTTPALAVAGLLVGFGSRLGSGCTSGHGVCGISRGSTRSIVATMTFMTTGALTALAITQLFAGSV
jgi:uncharacterized membrane protein YedE/YeeE